MTPERWRLVTEIFGSALEREPEERAGFLKRSCGRDDDLKDEVESLLSSYEPNDSFLDTPAAGSLAKSLLCEPIESLIGKEIGPYRIVRELGRGGMGDVYLAQDGRLQRPVALKLLPLHFSFDPELLRRFEQEAYAVSSLNHPNIVTVHEIGSTGSTHFMATEFVDGITLRDRVSGFSRRAHNNGDAADRAPLELNEALDIAVQIASALTVAHEAGIIHRDVKPENVMLRRDGVVKVLDFGLAKREPTIGTLEASSEKRSDSKPGVVMGTAHYMSPEQARGEEVDARTDIWSLGIVLYEMVAGRVPFRGEAPSPVIASILEDLPLRLDHEENLPQELQAILDRALCKKTEERYQSASDLEFDLRNLKQDLELRARLQRSLNSAGSALHTAPLTLKSTAEYLVEKIKRRKQSAALVAVLVLLFATLAFSFYLKEGKSEIGAPGGTIDSIAVLPFINNAGDGNTDYLADGITDSVINSLSRLSKLRVISRSAVMRYKGKQMDPKVVGRELNVSAVLMGDMTQQGDSLAINTELVDVRDQTRLWGERYNRKLSDILSVQEEIARKISESLRLELSGEEKKQLEKQYTQNSEAYLLYSLGRHHFLKNTKEGFEKSIEYYDQAIKLDPKYALAYVGLSRSYFELQWRGFLIPKEGLRKSEWAAMKSVDLDETLSEAHVALARSKRFFDWATSEKEYKRALELNPNSVDANRDYATYLAFSGRVNEAFEYAQRADEISRSLLEGPRQYLPLIHLLSRQYDQAIELHLEAIKKFPNNAQIHFFLGEVYVAKGMYKESIAALQKAVSLDNAPERWDRHPMLAYAYAVSGETQEALKILKEQKRLAKQRYIPNYNFAIIYTGLGDMNRAFEYLNKAMDDGQPATHVPFRPMFDILRSDPRYAELLKRIPSTSRAE